MSSESNEIKEKVSVDTKQKSTRRNPMMQIINGEFLSREFVLNNLNFIFFSLLLLVLLVSKGYAVKQLNKDVDNGQSMLDELTGDYVAKKARLEEETRRIKLVEELTPIGLKETVNPTKVIRLNKQEVEK
jgi:hypothetical protein